MTSFDSRLEQLALRADGGLALDLDAIDPDDTLGSTREEAERRTRDNLAALEELQYRLWAENRRALLVVLQGMDASGKDGTVRNVFGTMNPEGVHVTSFKAPSDEERDHDFLWRIHKAVPSRGQVGVFNRSHYEDVLVVRVDSLVPRAVWQARYGQINEFERLLAAEGVTVLKFFLHISRKEQRQRLIERIEDPRKNWKFDEGDFAKRAKWAEYRAAYQEALARCGTPHAPWWIVPADKPWSRNHVISTVVRRTLEAMNPVLPTLRLSNERLKAFKEMQ